MSLAAQKCEWGLARSWLLASLKPLPPSGCTPVLKTNGDGPEFAPTGGDRPCYDAVVMTRRKMLPTAAAAALAGSAAAADPPKNAIIELRRFQLRNSPDNQRQRNTDFLRQRAA